MGIERKSKCQDLVSVKCEKKKKMHHGVVNYILGKLLMFFVCVFI